MHNRILCGTFVIAVTGALASGCSVNYGTEMQKTFQATFKDSFKDYQYFGMPVSGYGVGTMYPKSAKIADFDPTTSGLYGDPTTWWDKKLTDNQKAQYFNDLFGDARTGQIALQLSKDTKFDLDVVLPSLYKLLSASSKNSLSKSIKVTLSADGAFNHRINWGIFEQDLRDGLIQDYVKQHYNANDFLITTADIVLINYQATLAFSSSLDTKDQADLTVAWKAFGKDANASFEFSDANSGTFTVKSKDPVVIATFIGEPPSAGLRHAGTPTVEPIQLPAEVRDRIVNASLYRAEVHSH
jgi:hypothetical protein